MDLEICSILIFVYDFSRKMFVMLVIFYHLTKVLLPLFLKILDNICITIVSFPSCDIIIFEINLVKPFSYVTKK